MFCREDSWTYRNFCATSFSASNPPVVLITNWIGRPVAPGGGWKATRKGDLLCMLVLLKLAHQEIEWVNPMGNAA
jgi:hypothetical protein